MYDVRYNRQPLFELNGHQNSYNLDLVGVQSVAADKRLLPLRLTTDTFLQRGLINDYVYGIQRRVSEFYPTIRPLSYEGSSVQARTIH